MWSGAMETKIHAVFCFKEGLHVLLWGDRNYKGNMRGNDQLLCIFLVLGYAIYLLIGYAVHFGEKVWNQVEGNSIPDVGE